jgi:hypothetical protein
MDPGPSAGHSRQLASPLDAVLPYLPQQLQPLVQVLQPHIDSVLRLIFAAFNDVARQLAPVLHKAVDAASPHLQVGLGSLAAAQWACSSTVLRRRFVDSHVPSLPHGPAQGVLEQVTVGGHNCPWAHGLVCCLPVLCVRRLETHSSCLADSAVCSATCSHGGSAPTPC